MHRVTIQWGCGSTSIPEHTLLKLEKALLQKHWIDTNRHFVPYGKLICTEQLPHCSTCPVLEMCLCLF